MSRSARAAVLAFVALAGCRSASGPARSPAPGAAGVASALAGAAGSERVGRWVVWAGARRTWGSFITAEGAGPLWPLDVAGSPRWSDDGRWLASCASGFVAARWMGSARPSRIAVANGGCEKLEWAPRGDRALSLNRGWNQAQMLSLTAGEQPRIVATNFEITLSAGERLATWSYLAWSPAGDGFLVTVDGPGHTGSPIRWVDATRQPGTVQQLVTREGFEAADQCWWAPDGKRIACRSSQPAPKQALPAGPRTALALFEVADGRVTGRAVFEAPWFALQQLGWLDADRLVFQDRDATRLLDVTGSEPPITLSTTADDFAISPTAPRVAYLNHRGLCLRDAGDKLGPERLLVAGRWKGVQWSNGGRHLLSHRSDQRVAVVVADATSARPQVYQTTEAPAGFSLAADFSPGEALLFTRAVPNQVTTDEVPPLQLWPLADFTARRLLPDGFSDRWLAVSPDDTALVTQRAQPPSSLFLALLRDNKATPRPLADAAPDAQVRWQPGRAIATSETPSPAPPADPARERVTLAATDPISLGTAYVKGSRGCSGALIDPMYVVTAQHCVEGARAAVQVVLGRGLAWEREYSVPIFRILQHPKVRRIERLDLFEYDLALIELPEAAPTEARPLPLAEAQEGTLGAEIYLAGYGGDHFRGLTTQPELRYGKSRLVAADPGIAGALAWRSAEGADNAGCFGDSGGPVLVRRGDGSFALLAIHFGSGGTDYTLACGRDGVGGNLAAERTWLNEAADKLALSRRGSGPPRPRATRF